MIRGKRFFLTGGAGFIGSAIARRVLDENEVVVFDNGHRNARAGDGLREHPNLRVIRGDVLDAPAVRDAMRGCHVVIHMASIAGVDTVIKMPVQTMRVALIGTYNVLEAAIQQETKVERLIDFSTSEVFGTYAYKVGEGDVTTLGAVGEARWTYAVSKLATEHLAHSYHRQLGLPALSVRPFNIYGPGQVGEGAIHTFIRLALKCEDLTIHNDGAQIRAWCYIDDIVEAILLCVEKPEAIGQAFNIGNARSVCTVHELARQIIRLSGSSSKLKFKEWAHADVELRVPNISRMRKTLGYEPRVDLEEGLLRTIEWYRSRVEA